MRIVIAEDSAVVRAGLAEILADSGHDVVAAVGNAEDLMAEGRSNTAIAAILVVSERSVESTSGTSSANSAYPPSDADHRRVLAGPPLPAILTGDTRRAQGGEAIAGDAEGASMRRP